MKRVVCSWKTSGTIFYIIFVDESRFWSDSFRTDYCVPSLRGVETSLRGGCGRNAVETMLY